MSEICGSENLNLKVCEWLNHCNWDFKSGIYEYSRSFQEPMELQRSVWMCHMGSVSASPLPEPFVLLGDINMTTAKGQANNQVKVWLCDSPPLVITRMYFTCVLLSILHSYSPPNHCCAPCLYFYWGFRIMSSAQFWLSIFLSPTASALPPQCLHQSPSPLNGLWCIKPWTSWSPWGRYNLRWTVSVSDGLILWCWYIMNWIWVVTRSQLWELYKGKCQRSFE